MNFEALSIVYNEDGGVYAYDGIIQMVVLNDNGYPSYTNNEFVFLQYDANQDVSTSTSSAPDCDYVTSTCDSEIAWALSTGRYNNPGWYAGFAEQTGVALNDATASDMVLYWTCTTIPNAQKCGGLSSCRTCGGGAVVTASCASYGCVAYDQSHDCQCNTECDRFGSCCSDYSNVCASEINPFVQRPSDIVDKPDGGVGGLDMTTLLIGSLVVIIVCLLFAVNGVVWMMRQ